MCLVEDGADTARPDLASVKARREIEGALVRVLEAWVGLLGLGIVMVPRLAALQNETQTS